MDEVDNIIIDSLRSIDCYLDDSVTNLKSFSDDNVIHALSSCLKLIAPSEMSKSLPSKMPATMSAKLKLANNIVEQIKAMGFRGDVGYQSILYFNEIEIRRILMYLIERIPKENSKLGTAAEFVGYVPNLVKDIEEAVRLGLTKSWIPSQMFQKSLPIENNSNFMPNYGSTKQLHSKCIKIPSTQNGTEDLKEYWVHHTPKVTKQCNQSELIPSLLFRDVCWTDVEKLRAFLKKTSEDMTMQSIVDLPTKQINDLIQTNHSMPANDANEIDLNIENNLKKIRKGKETYKELQTKVKECNNKLIQLKETSEKLQSSIKEASNQLKIKCRTLTVLSKEENMEKLQNLVDNGNERILELENQWNQVQTPLLEEYKTLQASLSDQELKVRSRTEKITKLKTKIQQLQEELEIKLQMESKLREDSNKINNVTNRAAYTKRILEIISNIKKQDNDILKILKDTREIQKEIHTLSGQLDRSFTIADVLIFKDAKVDETAKKCYKLLAKLHIDCESILQAVTDIGLIERECRNLQDQIDAEINKDIGSKLTRVLTDIEELKQENS